MRVSSLIGQEMRAHCARSSKSDGLIEAPLGKEAAVNFLLNKVGTFYTTTGLRPAKKKPTRIIAITADSESNPAMRVVLA